MLAAFAAGLALILMAGQAGQPTAPEPGLGNLLAVLGSVAWAATVMGLRLLAREGEGAGGTELGAVLCGNLLLAVPLTLRLLFAPAAAPDGVDLAVVAYLGVFQVAVAYLLLTAGLARVGAFTTSLLLLVYPALSPLWAWALHAEVPHPLALTGGAVLLLATGLLAVRDRGARKVGAREDRPQV